MNRFESGETGTPDKKERICVMYPAVLIVDDETTIIESLSGILSDDGFEVIHAFNGYEALKKIETESPDIVLLDIWMPGMDGIETLREIKLKFPNIPVVMITGHGSIESAVDATKSGAFDFLEKPLSIDKVMVTINNALNFRKLEEENLYLRKKTIEKNSITGTSPAVQKLYQEVMVAAPTDAAILITGENGTGKEMVARTTHQFSRRPEEHSSSLTARPSPRKPWTVNCSAMKKGPWAMRFPKTWANSNWRPEEPCFWMRSVT